MTYHVPVLLQETVDGLDVGVGKRYIDATFGGGGHAREIKRKGGEVLGIDTDPDALLQAKRMNPDIRVVYGNFRDIEALAKAEGFNPVDGILFDLGVSSHQLDEENRGFSYRFPDAPFDLRLDQTKGIPASELINHESKEQLAAIIGQYGEEEHCRRIADLVVASRVKRPIATTGDVLRIIENIAKGNQRQETASRVFQAFRIAVNDELAAVKEGLDGAIRLLKPGGRIAVISFHSLEDRIVKQRFLGKDVRAVYRKPITAGSAERTANRRSRSAKLRIAEKL